jgi:Flp pilus assembly pilin Flp
VTIIVEEVPEMKAVLKRFLKDEEGLELVEYAVMTALIVATLVGVIVALALAIQGRFSGVEAVISSIT